MIKNNKTKKIIILLILLFTLCGCTKNLIDKNGKVTTSKVNN